MTSVLTRRSDGSRRPAIIRDRVRLEMRVFRRVREELVFTFALPIVLLALLATMFGGEVDDTGVDFSQYYVAGMLASTGITVGFQSLASQLAVERQNGTTKRLAGTPMPVGAYVAGKLGLVVGVAMIQAATMFVMGVLLFGVTLPMGPNWLLLGSVFALNLTVWTLLGVAVSRIISSPRAAGAVTTLPALVLQFISGVYVFSGDIPDWLQRIAQLFPLHWAARGFREALLPTSFGAIEDGGSWRTGMMFLTLVVWTLVGAVLARRGIRWGTDRDGRRLLTPAD